MQADRLTPQLVALWLTPMAATFAGFTGARFGAWWVVGVGVAAYLLAVGLLFWLLREGRSS